nr:MAG TPA: hypothetical protein [Caudoviricetes sp.]DAM38283.1 MAG TPA: hypothetical protein [Caudoviricetes sp.]
MLIKIRYEFYFYDFAVSKRLKKLNLMHFL